MIFAVIISKIVFTGAPIDYELLLILSVLEKI